MAEGEKVRKSLKHKNCVSLSSRTECSVTSVGCQICRLLGTSWGRSHAGPEGGLPTSCSGQEGVHQAPRACTGIGITFQLRRNLFTETVGCGVWRDQPADRSMRSVRVLVELLRAGVHRRGANACPHQLCLKTMEGPKHTTQ